MARLVRFVIAVVVLLFLYRTGLPWIRARLGSRSDAAATTPPATASCVDRVERIHSEWASGLGDYAQPPTDLGAWSGFRAGIEGGLASARGACGCIEESCRKATEAIERLEGLIRTVDASLREGSPPPVEVPRLEEEIGLLLEQARSAE